MDDRLKQLQSRFTDYCSFHVEKTKNGVLILATSHTGALVSSCYLSDDQDRNLTDRMLGEFEQTLIVKRARG